jgi:hypothetical protein
VIYLTLATGTDRWDESGSLKEQGAIWHLTYDKEEGRPVLNPEVADWCWDNIGAYRIIEHLPSQSIGREGDDSWRIEFKSVTDMTFFKLRWF